MPEVVLVISTSTISGDGLSVLPLTPFETRCSTTARPSRPLAPDPESAGSQGLSGALLSKGATPTEMSEEERTCDHCKLVIEAGHLAILPVMYSRDEMVNLPVQHSMALLSSPSDLQ